MPQTKNVTIKVGSSFRVPAFVYTIIAVMTAMVGYHIHSSTFWAVVDFFFWPLAWCKWLVCQEVNMTIIRETFSFFFK